LAFEFGEELRPDEPPAVVRDLDEFWPRPAEADLGFPPFPAEAAPDRFLLAVAVDDEVCRFPALLLPPLPAPPLRADPERVPRDELDDAERLLVLFLFSAIADSN